MYSALQTIYWKWDSVLVLENSQPVANVMWNHNKHKTNSHQKPNTNPKKRWQPTKKVHVLQTQRIVEKISHL